MGKPLTAADLIKMLSAVNPSTQIAIAFPDMGSDELVSVSLMENTGVEIKGHLILLVDDVVMPSEAKVDEGLWDRLTE